MIAGIVEQLADSARFRKGKGARMPRVIARTDDGQELHVHLPEILSWVLGIAATFICAATLWLFATVASLDNRVGRVEQVVEEVVPRSEYSANQRTTIERLDRIENKLDRLLENR